MGVKKRGGSGSEPEDKNEENKGPSQTSNEEEKGGFGEWYKNNLGASILLTIISLYIFSIFVYMVVVEIMQQKDMCKYGTNGIYFDLVEDTDDNDTLDKKKNIKPVFGSFKRFTKEGRFKKDIYDSATITYKGFKRLTVNFVAAATFAKYTCNIIYEEA